MVWFFSRPWSIVLHMQCSLQCCKTCKQSSQALSQYQGLDHRGMPPLACMLIEYCWHLLERVNLQSLQLQWKSYKLYCAWQAAWAKFPYSSIRLLQLDRVYVQEKERREDSYMFSGGKLVIVNLQKTPKDKKASLVLHTRVDDLMREVMQRCQIPIPVYRRCVAFRCISRELSRSSSGLRCVQVSVEGSDQTSSPFITSADFRIEVTGCLDCITWHATSFKSLCSQSSKADTEDHEHPSMQWQDQF